MVPDSERYGVKGATLQYIKDNLPDLPIEPFILVDINEDPRSKMLDAMRFRDFFIRSSSPVEDKLGQSFAGLFHTGYKSIHCDVEMLEIYIGAVESSIEKPDILRYAEIHDVSTPIPLTLFFHKSSTSQMNYTMIRHPHQQELLLVQGRPRRSKFSSTNLVINQETGQGFDVFKWMRRGFNGTNDVKQTAFSQGVQDAVKSFTQIEQLDGFDDGIAYQMEFGSNPFSIYQFRPFRKKETSSWKIDEDFFEQFGEDDWAHKAGLSFGITGEEGIPLRALQVYDSHTMSRYTEAVFARGEKTNEDLLHELRELKLIDGMDDIYLEQLSRVTSDSTISAYGAQEKAIRMIAEKIGPEKTCIHGRNMHANSFHEMDLLVPESGAYVGEGAADFISHNWVRQFEHYPIAMAGVGTHEESGTEVQVYSDGVFGVVLERY